MDAVVTAGGRISGEFAERSGVTVKALLEVGGKPVIHTVIDAIRGVPEVDKIFLVGPAELAHSPIASSIDELIPDTGDGAANFIAGVERCSGERALFAASDLPFLTIESIRSFLNLCPPDADFCYPVLRKERFLQAYKTTHSKFVALKEGEFTGGCVFQINPAALLANKDLINRVFTSRKSPFKLASILGWSFCLRLLTHTADIAHCAKRGSELMNSNCRVVVNCPPELAYDMDNPEDYEFALRYAGGAYA